MTKPILTITPFKANAPLSSATELAFLVTVAVPLASSPTAVKRPPLNLAQVLDRSGSMRGQPLNEAKACAKRVVEALVPGDRVAVVAYGSKVETIVASTEIGSDKSRILRAIDGITTEGMTNLHGGWIAGAEEAAAGLAPGVLTRVLLLSDGNANVGVNDPMELARQSGELAEKGIVTTTLGLGTNFNEDLMLGMAEAGHGTATYGESAEDLWPSFETELGLMSATFGKNTRLQLRSPCGGTVSVENDYRLDQAGRWILPNLAHGAEVSALVKVAVSGLQGASVQALEATLTYDDVDGASCDPLGANSELPLVPFADFVIGVPDAKVAGKLKEVEASRLQIRAKEAARAGDFVAVRSVAAQMGAMAEGDELLSGMAVRMSRLAEQGDGVMLAKEAAYATSTLLRSYSSAEASASGSRGEGLFRKRVRQGKAD